MNGTGASDVVRAERRKPPVTAERPDGVALLARTVESLGTSLLRESRSRIAPEALVERAMRAIVGRLVASEATHLGEPEPPWNQHLPARTPADHAWADPLTLGAAYESMLLLRPRVNQGFLELKPARGHARKRRGAYYTPEWLVRLVLDSALDPLLRSATGDSLLDLRILDPACGSGVFLVHAAERLAQRLAELRSGTQPSERALAQALREVCRRCVFGMDSDPVAVDLCRAALWARGGGAGLADRVVVADGLLDDAPGPGPFDAVVGNPPFLNRLERDTAVGRATAARLKDRFGPAARAYTDVSALFLLRAIELTRRGGRIAMVQPQSLLGTRDAAGVRAEASRRAALHEIWLADDQVFDASVLVCVPTLEAGAPKTAKVKRRVGPGRASRPPVKLTGESWAALAAMDVPELIVPEAETIADFADVTADFRDEYYGLRGLVVEDSASVRDASLWPRLVTTGLIGPGHCRWGIAPCRFAGQRWQAPRVDRSRLDATMVLWAAKRLVPKVLLATQTPILEVAVDERGAWLPVTPLISIVPRKPADLWVVGAALASPVLSALAAQTSAGTGLSRGAIKLSATQVRGLPIPSGLSEAARLFRRAVRAQGSSRDALLDASGQAACRAYGLSATKTREVMDWWTGRKGSTRQPG